MNPFRTNKLFAGVLLGLALALTGCLTDDGATGPTISTSPSDQTVSSGSQATFSVVASGSGSLSYQWTRNGQDIPGATSATYTVTVGPNDDEAVYRVKVTDSKGTTTSSAATLRILVGTRTVTLGAQSNSTTASSIDLDTWTTYLANTAQANSHLIDIVFGYSTANSQAAIYSPHAAKAGIGGSAGFDFMQNWATAHNTPLRTVTVANWDNVRTATDIRALFDAGTAPNPAGRIFVQPGTTIVAQSSGGLYVLLRIESVTQSASGTASLTGKAKW